MVFLGFKANAVISWRIELFARTGPYREKELKLEVSVRVRVRVRVSVRVLEV